jgi:NTP pyrophosphatase (non-canonical NTP hydrolase)
VKIKDYQPHTRTEAIGWLIEEAVEVIHAAASCYRWGADNVHEGRPNVQILKDEIEDLKKAIEAVLHFL